MSAMNEHIVDLMPNRTGNVVDLIQNQIVRIKVLIVNNILSSHSLLIPVSPLVKLVKARMKWLND